MEQVFSNVIEGKPRAQWLDGTGLDGKPVKDQKLAMKTLLEEASKQVKQAMKAKDRGGVERSSQKQEQPAGNWLDRTDGEVRAGLLPAAGRDAVTESESVKLSKWQGICRHG